MLLSFIIVIFTIGLIFSIELLWRTFGPLAARGTLIDVGLFPYQNYVVSTHPPNLKLGKSNHILESYFGKNVCADEEGFTAKFNSDGFRTQDLRNVPAKEPNEVRIIITGGSASISWGIGEACTLDNNLIRLFQQKFPHKKIRIFNLGNGAWKSFQELIALQLYGITLQPDLIIAFDGFNDIQHAYFMPIDKPYSNYAETAFQQYQQWHHGKAMELFTSLKIVKAIADPSLVAIRMAGRIKNQIQQKIPYLAKSPMPGNVGTTLSYPLDIEQIKARTDFDPYNQEVVNFYLNNERLIAKVAQMTGAKMMFVLQPVLYVKTPLSDSERKTLDSYGTSVNFVVQGLERMKLGLRKITEEEKHTYFYDMSNVFENDKNTYFGDNCHFNADGYKIVSNKLFEHIVSTLDLK